VAKLYDINPSLAEMNGFLEDLAGMVADSHSINENQVVSNAVAALSEIMEESGNRFLQAPGVLQKLLTALNECNE